MECQVYWTAMRFKDRRKSVLPKNLSFYVKRTEDIELRLTIEIVMWCISLVYKTTELIIY